MAASDSWAGRDDHRGRGEAAAGDAGADVVGRVGVVGFALPGLPRSRPNRGGRSGCPAGVAMRWVSTFSSRARRSRRRA